MDLLEFFLKLSHADDDARLPGQKESCHLTSRRWSDIFRSKCISWDRLTILFTNFFAAVFHPLTVKKEISLESFTNRVEVLVEDDIVMALDGVIPNIKELYMHLLKDSNSRRRTAFHRDAYMLITGDFSLLDTGLLVVHHPLEAWHLRTYNVVDNLVKMTRRDHTRYHKSKKPV